MTPESWLQTVAGSGGVIAERSASIAERRKRIKGAVRGAEPHGRGDHRRQSCEVSGPDGRVGGDDFEGGDTTMARGKTWADDSTKQVKFAGGGSLTIAYKGNMFDLLLNEQALITKLTDVIQNFKHMSEPEVLAEEKTWP